jgi:hypothetical protein
MYKEEREAILLANPWLKPWTERWVEDVRIRGAVGYASRNTVVIAPYQCQQPGRGYSWPGSVSDRTAKGVYRHEVGHLVHAAFGREEAAMLAGLRDLGGPRVTGYEPNPMETFAETFRLYAGNPALLEAGRPWRFEYLYGLGIRPPARRPRQWQRGLEGKPPARFVEQCERWIERGAVWLAK